MRFKIKFQQQTFIWENGVDRNETETYAGRLAFMFQLYRMVVVLRRSQLWLRHRLHRAYQDLAIFCPLTLVQLFLVIVRVRATSLFVAVVVVVVFTLRFFTSTNGGWYFCFDLHSCFVFLWTLLAVITIEVLFWSFFVALTFRLL